MSLQKVAKKAKLVLSSIPPVVRVTLNRPGRGGPFVVTVMAALNAPQASVNASVERSARAEAARTKFTTRVLPTGTTELTGIRALVDSLAEESARLHTALHED